MFDRAVGVEARLAWRLQCPPPMLHVAALLAVSSALAAEDPELLGSPPPPPPAAVVTPSHSVPEPPQEKFSAGTAGGQQHARQALVQPAPVQQAAEEKEREEEEPGQRRPQHKSAWAERPFAVLLHAGVATPVGLTGAMLDYAPVEWLSLSCGAGTNLSGLELACMVRPRWILRQKLALSLGLGASMAPFSLSGATEGGVLASFMIWDELFRDGGTRKWYWERAYFANLDFGPEWRFPTSGFTVRPYAGLSYLLNAGTDAVFDSGAQAGASQGDVDRLRLLVYIGAAVGYAL